MDEELVGRTAVVTGAASGIGRAIARRYAEAGASVVVADVRADPREGGRPTHVVIEEDGHRATFVDCDVSHPEALEDAVDVAGEFGGVDVMVNNAGVFRTQRFVEVTEAAYDEVMDVNAKGAFFGSQAAAKRMLDAGGGVIINVSSTAGLYGVGEYVAYCMSKGAIRLLTYALADALGPYDIRVNAIHPGVIESEMTRADSRVIGTERGSTFEDRIPMQRFGNPQEVAEAALYLASDRSAYVNGESLVVDGGLHSTG